MHKVTVFNLGNADTSRIDLENGKKILIDYANMRAENETENKKFADLPKELREDLVKCRRNYYDAVAFTHLDKDHTYGMSDFFYLEHAVKYQSDERVRINELWVPAAVILEEGCDDETRIIRQEARYRLKSGSGILVFSSPGILDNWLKDNGIDPATRKHLIIDAGSIIPTFNLDIDKIEFFVHSPFATRTEDGTLLDRNKDALTLQATFLNKSLKTRMHFFSDISWEIIKDIVRVTEFHGRKDTSRLERLKWDIFKIAHHCSYLSLSSEKGIDITVPDEDVKRLFEIYGENRSIQISTSKAIPTTDEDLQPPHRQAAKYYKSIAVKRDGKFLVTMEHKSISSPEPMVIIIDEYGATLQKSITSGSSIIGSTIIPRAGRI